MGWDFCMTRANRDKLHAQGSRLRRALLAGLTGLIALLISWTAAPGLAAPIPAAYDQTYRPQFHYSPAKNWMNDPNGLVFYQGQYHLFYQYNPLGNTWGNMSWGHAVSPDLVHWKELPVAIPYDDTELVFSGSAVVDKDNTSGFGTKANPPLVAIYTSAYKNKPIQAQSLAYSTDGGTTFTKYAGNPVLDIGSGEFRDPKVFWYAPAKAWRMVVVKATEHKVSIYSSPNLKDWTHLSDFGPAGAVGGVWECPDLFPLAVDGNTSNIKWVMVVNLNPGGIAGGSGGQYFVGDFDGTTFTSDDPATYTPPTGTVLEDFESTGFAPWTTTGAAFGDGPTAGNAPGQGGVSGYLGDKLANSFNGGDGTIGTLSSPEFTITSSYLNFLVGGGNHPHVAGTVLNGTPPSGPVFADFEGTTWGTGWTATDDFTNAGPVAGTIGDQQPVSGYLGDKLVNTFLDHDLSTGTITSPTFTVNSDYIDLLVGGGNHPFTANPSPGSEPTAVNLVVGGNVVATATGQDNETLNWVAWNTASWQGQQAQIQIIDNNTGGWGHINVDNIVFSPEAAIPVSTETAVNLLVNGKVVRTATGPNSEHLDWANWDVRDLAGQTATIQIVDNNTGGWGHILVDQFTFADAPALSATERAHWLDYGRDFYAGVTFNNVPNGRRIMIAWMNNWQYGGSIPTDPWRSAMSVPRELNLERIGGATELTAKPVQQLKALRQSQPFTAGKQRLLQGTTTLGQGARGDTVEILAEFKAQDAEKFGLNVRTGNGQQTVVGYDVNRDGIYVDRTKSGNVAFNATFPSVEFAPLKVENGIVTLRVLVDRSSVEVFADRGQRTITDQIFPDRDSKGIQLFSTGGRAELNKITIWQLQSAWQ
jgi:fructan beta-fructosidase